MNAVLVVVCQWNANNVSEKIGVFCFAKRNELTYVTSLGIKFVYTAVSAVVISCNTSLFEDQVFLRCCFCCCLKVKIRHFLKMKFVYVAVSAVVIS